MTVRNADAQMEPPADVTAVVLAGGRATRMEGRDKGLIDLAGRPMIAWILEAIGPQVGQVLISANRNLDAYERFGYPVVADLDAGFLGPLAGLATGMSHARTEYVVTVPCDSPLVAPDLVGRLYSTCVANGADIAVAHDGEWMQPVFALARTALAPDLRAWLATGERKVNRWFARHRLVEVNFSDRPDTFVNVNDPKERMALEARLTGGE